MDITAIKVMVVDDAATTRRIIIKSLNNNGVTHVTEADDGSTAWIKLKKADSQSELPDLIILDWNMPVMTGIELLSKIRGDVVLKPIRVLMVTAEANQDNVIEAVKHGTDGYMLKPFTSEELISQIKKIFGI